MKHPLFLLLLLIASIVRAQVEVPAKLDHQPFDRLLKEYVDEQGLVDYRRWKSTPNDLQALDDYLREFESVPTSKAEGDAKAAALINLYNALVIRYILENYPTNSIMALADPFGEARHTVGGRQISLNDIEHNTLRPQLGYRAHPVLVCAARSCPPLQRDAYTASALDSQIDQAFRVWLGRKDLNRFEPEKNRAMISSIFDWFKGDFRKAGGVRPILARFAPMEYRHFLSGPDYEIKYLPYNWGLNDQGDRGRRYGRINLYMDRVFDTLKFWD